MGGGGCELERAVGKDYNCKASNFVPLFIGLNLFIHSTSISKISSMSWKLERQSIHSSFHSTVLNVASVPAAPNRPCMVISAQMQSGVLASGNDEETNCTGSWMEEVSGRGLFNLRLGSTRSPN